MVEKSVMMVIIILLIRWKVWATEQVALFFLRLFSLARCFPAKFLAGEHFIMKKCVFLFIHIFIHT